MQQVDAADEAWGHGCFNPLRGRQTLQLGDSITLTGINLYVSILYEADRLCNQDHLHRVPQVQKVSILYEADRLCNHLPRAELG